MLVQDITKFKMKFVVALVLVAVLTVYVDYTNAEEFVCEQGVPYIENACNGCFCGKSGQVSCTYMACFGPAQTKAQNCEVGSTYDKECNKCWCRERLGEICTNKKC